LISGKTDLLIAAVTSISLAAAVTDVLRGRIYNWLTLPALLCGFAAAFWLRGWSGAGDALLGASAGLLFYGWMFALRLMGGGDVKLLMALGAWGGLAFTEEVALLGVLLGGVFAALLLVFKGRAFAFYAKMKRFLLTVFVRELELQLPEIDRKLTMPFGVPIAAAAIWSAVSHPLLAMGFRPWP
jgi:prepilin peptidase CpaA